MEDFIIAMLGNPTADMVEEQEAALKEAAETKDSD